MRQYTLVFSIFLLLFSCTVEKGEAYISDFNKFITSVEENYLTYSQEDWDKADKKFNTLSTIQYQKCKEQLSSEQNTEINKLIGKYQALRLQSMINSTGSQINNMLEQAAGFAEEFLNDLNINENQ